MVDLREIHQHIEIWCFEWLKTTSLAGVKQCIMKVSAVNSTPEYVTGNILMFVLSSCFCAL